MNKPAKLTEMFSLYHPSEERLRWMQQANVINADINLEYRRASVRIETDQYVSEKELRALSEELAKLYQIQTLELLPIFPAEAYSAFQFEELNDVLIAAYPPAISILLGCRWEDDGQDLKLFLRANGVDMIKPHLHHAERYLADRFSVQRKIEVIPGSGVDGKALFAEMEKLRQADIEKLPTPKFEGKNSAEKKPEQDMIFGKPFRGERVAMRDVTEESGRIVIEGTVFAVAHSEKKKSGAWVISFDVTDLTGSVRVNQFMKEDKAKPILDGIKIGMCVRVLGNMVFDGYLNEPVLQPLAIMRAESQSRSDTAPQKRVELHLHTSLSAMDALTDAGQIVKQAAKWGHPAIAITDHGVAQAFPDAMHAAERATVAGTDELIKVLYGCEAYYYDDSKDVPLDSEIVALDFETTGLSSERDTIIEIGAAIFKNGKPIAEFKQLIDPQRPLSETITKLTGISEDMLKGQPLIEEILPKFLEFCGDRPLAAHNAEFDVGFLLAACRRCGIDYDPVYVDSLTLARSLMPELRKYKLDIVAQALKLPEFQHHRALDDAMTVGYMLGSFADMLREKGVSHFRRGSDKKSSAGAAPTYHMILLAKNQIGLRNLYRLISYAHLKYFYRRPRIPRSELVRYREGLIIGSACEAGELFRAIVANKSWDELCKIASFYDYLEIQPICNNRFMIEEGMAADDEALREFNRTVVRLGEALNKPVVATCDVHFAQPEDEIYRNILLATKGMGGDHPLPLYFRSTDEMLEEFSYLGEEKAYEVVVTNTCKIADMCERLRPVPHNLFAPKIENSAEDLHRLVYGKLHALYGENPPELIQKRVDTEMHDIITCHYDVIYMSAQMLVQNSLENGYIVGSRGSVGSSLVAFMSGITEVNSLPPHYRCPNCKHTTFKIPEGYACGADLPDAVCPVCGAQYEKDGFNIPFETFLGFGGDKGPDIDLNFSGEYQARAHNYCVQMFGSDHVFRAGTIGTVAEKTAYGYVKKYLEEQGMTVSKADENRLAMGCVGVKRTTGQHPGGLVVIPQENEIWDFCPVQHPADATDDDAWITTHFEYHSMEENLLKLDMLGHDDPTMICLLENITGVKAQTIPLDDRDTMSIFTSSKVLGYEGDKVLGPTGAAGIPEFGTRNARNMLVETQPEQFDILVRLSGFSHGTDVWHGNARDLVLSGTAKVGEAIGCRDDIMLYLISKGMDEKRAFKFMEAVRKGAIHKGKPWPDGIEKEMQELGVPQWYIDSCHKIKYLFPKAHAVAYVIMAFRIAWYKVHEPLAFYAAYFYRRSQKDAFDAALMTQGKEAVLDAMKRIEKNPNMTDKDKTLLVTLEMCYEFYLRGFSFLPMDIYESEALHFRIKDGKLIPPFVAVAGLGETAAKDIEAGREGRTFLSIEEFAAACPKVSKTHIENLKEAGAFGDLPDTSQITLF